MTANGRYSLVAVLGFVAILVGSGIFAAAAADGGDGDDSTRIFAGVLGFSIAASGVGMLIATAAAFLARRD